MWQESVNEKSLSYIGHDTMNPKILHSKIHKYYALKISKNQVSMNSRSKVTIFPKFPLKKITVGKLNSLNIYEKEE